MKDIFTQHISELITGAIALILGYFGKGKVQKRSDNADLTAKIQAVYKEMVADTDASMDALRAEVNTLTEKLLESDENWKKKVAELKSKQAEIDESWKKKIAAVEKKWQTKYSLLKKQFENYKRTHP